MKFEAIIFDFDGVIVDSESVSNAALAAVLTKMGLPTTTRQALERYCGHRWSDCHRLIEQDLGCAVDVGAIAAQVDHAVEARVEEVLAIAGLEPFLERQAHRKLAIASSSEKEWLDGSLARLGLAGWFGGHVYSASGLARGKPHPDVYLHAATALGVAPRQCLVIEDHPLGATAGVAAGMTVIGLLAGSHILPGHEGRLAAAGVPYVAKSYVEAAEILARLEENDVKASL